ncbi:Flagellar basal-body rod modification protein FlgD [Marinobacterium lacunae]|uniref:Basal-body rod modification protein FlgD n=2 Tax=Marinobacterium lacunae TaxID=1232683 RepID=A0A081G0M4_9GAMM|nr:Flagellar basal-body rod modification protein FlgD [Marinobacterium lacunae]
MFMELLIAQLQNQDPTDPTDTAEYMNQMATLTQVESTMALSDSLEELSSSLSTSQKALQASSLVGQNIFVEAETAELDDSGTIDGAFVLSTSASDVRYTVYDSEGNRVDQISLGSQLSGTQNFTWNGAGNEAGTYTVVVEADTGDGYEEITAYLPQNVNSVTLGTSGSSLTINTDLGQFTMDDVLQIG